MLSAIALLGFPWVTLLGIYGLWVLFNKTPSDCSLAAPRHSVKVMAIDPTAIGPAGDSSPISSFGVYEIRALLGAGGMGQVYRAFDSRLGREIALKVIRRSAVDDESALDRLLREATLASALNHPNIVTIYETGVVGADRYIAMELIEGATLRQLAAQGLPLSRIVGIARQVAEALAVAHAQQIVHRDIKPDNVMVRPDGYVKLLDFGLARAQPNRYGAERPAGARRAPRPA